MRKKLETSQDLTAIETLREQNKECDIWAEIYHIGMFMIGLVMCYAALLLN